MGLFGSKKLCPLCGNPTSWFLPTKVEGQPLCDDCGAKVSGLPDDIRDTVLATLDSVRKYTGVYEENQPLRDRFQETFRYKFGLIEGCISLDLNQRLIRLGKEKAFVFESKGFERFLILEDDAPLFEGTREGLVCYCSTAPDKARGMSREIDFYLMEMRRVEHMRHMEDRREREAQARGENYNKEYISEPSVDRLNPFQKFCLKVEMSYPFEKLEKQFRRDGPSFGSISPSIEKYLSDYEAAAADMRDLAEKLMVIMNPDAPVREVGASATDPGSRAMPAAAAPADPVVEIQRYKALLDSGVITDEEFTAKKRQLLGI